MKLRNNVSIIIPTYNRSNYLDTCLFSTRYLDQSFSEIVVSDNNSSDNTKDIVTKHMKKDKRIVYFKNQKNLGPQKNFFSGLLKCKNNYFLFCSDDDILYPKTCNKLIKMTKILGRDNIGFIAGRCERKNLHSNSVSSVVPSFLKSEGLYLGESAAKFLLDESILWTTCIFNKKIFFDLCRKKFFLESKAVENLAIDMWIINCIALTSGFYLFHEICGSFNHHSDQISSTKKQSIWKSMMRSRINSFGVFTNKISNEFNKKIVIKQALYAKACGINCILKNQKNLALYFFQISKEKLSNIKICSFFLFCNFVIIASFYYALKSKKNQIIKIFDFFAWLYKKITSNTSLFQIRFSNID